MIENKADLIKNACNEKDKRCREILLDIAENAIYSVDPKNAIQKYVRLEQEGNVLHIDRYKLDLQKLGHIFIVGGGKASGVMAEALETILGDKITSGEINVLRGTKSNFNTKAIRLNEADHPVPSIDGVNGVKKMLDLVDQAKEGDLVIALISGGGSALMPAPAGDISLEEKQELTKSLLKSGATIHEINTVRKHISAFKGGQLAEHACKNGATLISLILSDVVGDPLDSIASGPTAPDETYYKDAIEILRLYKLWDDTSETIKRRLNDGLAQKIPETPKKKPLSCHNIIIGSNFIACAAAKRRAEELGLNSIILTSSLEGESRHIGIAFAAIAKEIHTHGHPLPKPCAIIAGGETTVTVTGTGKGGRNQEVSLGAAINLGEKLEGIAFGSIGTDGIDGPTDAAGALIDSSTILRARKLGANPLESLKNNDAYHFFQNLNDLIFTGPTGTNVMDLLIIICM
ncbi:MAG: glycerate kinase [Promethearchaeota archaeon]